MSTLSMKRRLERILDTGSGGRREVIVQRREEDPAVVAAFDEIGRALTARQFARSPGDMLPPPRRVAAGPAGRHADDRPASLAARSLAAPLTAIERHAIGVAQKLRQRGGVIVDQLLARARGEVRELWLADAVVALVDKDDLHAMMRDDTHGVDVFDNEEVRLPPFSPTSRPMSVTDERGSSYGLQVTGALAAWGAFGARGGGVRVAVLDTGVDPDHPDIAGKIAGFAEMDATGGEVAGAQARDTGTHGTHVAGTVLGGNASGAWVGMAPEARLLAGIVLPGGAGTIAQILGGMQWAIRNGADVINMSLGSLNLEPDVRSPYNQAIINALRAGVPVVCAIGNDGHVVTGPPGNDPFAFAVGATDERDNAAGFSGGRSHRFIDDDQAPPNFQPFVYMKPDVSAPGVGIVSAVPGGRWQAMSGTSMATPHVAGAIAQLLSASGIKDRLQGVERALTIQDLISGSAEDLGEADRDQRYGAGRLDVLAACAEALRNGFGPVGNA